MRVCARTCAYICVPTHEGARIGAWRKKLDRSRTRGATVSRFLSSGRLVSRPETKKELGPGDEEEVKEYKGERERERGGVRPPTKSPSAFLGQPPRVRDAESYTLDTAAPHSGYMACHPEYYSSRLTAQSVNARYCLTRVAVRSVEMACGIVPLLH